MLWINGKLSDGRDLVLDDGFLFGRGVFETIRVHEKPLFWTEHIRRLNSGLAALTVRPPVDEAVLLNQVMALPIRNCVMKIAVSPANLVFQTRPLPESTSAEWRLSISDGHRTVNPILLASKSLNYLDNLLAWEKANQQGFDDALLLNAAGQVCETSRANVFFVQEGLLYTPDLACGLLDGVIRHWVLSRFPVETGTYQLQDLLSAEGVFVTSSVIGIQPVSQIGTQVFPETPMVRRIREFYQDEIILR